ncbi:MAG: pyridoxamine 5'-phosphate oxidase family protein [Thaumarchaeota archaeon]|nr:pyridoxamine 5'-phosphate oxidase family protein [Nitrososphaerota archaeon]
MGLLTNEIKNLLSQQKLGYVATVSPDNTPNLSPKGTISVWDDEHLVFADIKSPNTIANLEKNPSLEINVVDPITRKGYRFKGTGNILSSGQEYDKIISYYNNVGIKSKIGRVVLIKVSSVKNVTSPLYDLGYTEEEIKKRWKEYYLSK